MNDLPRWNFPPTNGGIEVIQDAAMAHFNDDPLPKLVREVLQNSLDAKDNDLSGPVEVVFEESWVASEFVGAAELEDHLAACRERAKKDEKPKLQEAYAKAVAAAQSDEIRCLRIIDSGTKGSSGANWNALVRQEGSVQKSGDNPGGSYGIGKNAVFNASSLRTAFYSTRYLNLKEGGRVEKCQGKANLMAHELAWRATDSNPSPATRQHIGFYQLASGQPLRNTQIPDFFRLKDIGTGVFILGFDPRTSQWTKEVVQATIENFFYAIHHKGLVVKVRPADGEPVDINHEKLDILFRDLGPDSPSRHFYLAIRESEPVQTDSFDRLGVLNFYLRLNEGPRRTAHINRNGMLITDSLEQKVNPLPPRRNNLWPDYAAVVTPGSNAGDQWLRNMENPSHDALSANQLSDEAERREAESIIRKARRKLRAIIDEKTMINQYGDTSNLRELAQYFPELNPDAPGNRALKTESLPTRGMRAPVEVIIDEKGDDTTPESTPDDILDQGEHPGPGPGPDPNPNRPRRKESGERRVRSRLTRPRFIPTTSQAATIAFTTAADLNGPLKLALLPAGCEREKQRKIEVTSVQAVSPAELPVSLESGLVSLTPAPGQRIVLKVSAGQPISGIAINIGTYQRQENEKEEPGE